MELPEIFGGFCKKGLDSNGRMILAVGVEKPDVILKSKAKGLDFQFQRSTFLKRRAGLVGFL